MDNMYNFEHEANPWDRQVHAQQHHQLAPSSLQRYLQNAPPDAQKQPQRHPQLGASPIDTFGQSFGLHPYGFELLLYDLQLHESTDFLTNNNPNNTNNNANISSNANNGNSAYLAIPHGLNSDQNPNPNSTPDTSTSIPEPYVQSMAEVPEFAGNPHKQFTPDYGIFASKQTPILADINGDQQAPPPAQYAADVNSNTLHSSQPNALYRPNTGDISPKLPSYAVSSIAAISSDTSKRKPSTNISHSKIKTSATTSSSKALPKKVASTKLKQSSKLRQTSDSAFDGSKARNGRKPNMFLPLDNLGNGGAGTADSNSQYSFPTFPHFSAFSDSTVASNYERMRILLQNGGSAGISNGGMNLLTPGTAAVTSIADSDGDFDLYNFHDNVTPLMQPPSANADLGYFGYKGGDGNSPSFPLQEPKPLNEGNENDLHAEIEIEKLVGGTNSGFMFQPYFEDLGGDILSFGESPARQQVLHEQDHQLQQRDQPKFQPSQHTHEIKLDSPRPKMERSFSTNSVVTNTAVTSVNAGEKAKKKRLPKGAICQVCGKYISRDMTRHMRIHDETGRFQCVYPKEMCNHKTGNFNRPYDYKKHLLHIHFDFDDPKGKTSHTLTDKLPLTGACKACKQRYTANDWLEKHILSVEERCLYIPTFADHGQVEE